MLLSEVTDHLALADTLSCNLGTEQPLIDIWVRPLIVASVGSKQLIIRHKQQYRFDIN